MSACSFFLKMACFVVLLAVLTVSSGLPVENAGERSPPAIVGSLDQSAESSESHSESILPSEYDTSSEALNSEELYGAPSHELTHSSELQGRHQTFFPSFANLFEPRQPLRLGFGQEGAYSQRPNSYRSLLNYPLFGGYRNVDFAKQTTHAALVDPNPGILGSGNFGVIKGGTFLGQGEGDESDAFSSFYNNGHGRPSVAYSANPRPNYNQDQFANFRDFAEINAPASSAFSHFVVVYANKNSTVNEVNERTKTAMVEPKNIIETLELLDDDVEHTTKQPKISKSKAKLAKSKMPEKKMKWKSVKAEKPELFEEPLLALS